MKVEYLEHMGSDVTVVNAARVSFDKQSSLYDWRYVELGGRTISVPVVDDRDRKLIAYLAEHNHWSPFAHPVVSFRWTAPIFVARQLAKHQVGLVWNEISRRYVDYKPELWWPEKWRKRAENAKQGSSDKEVTWISNNEWEGEPRKEAEEMAKDAVSIYGCMIDSGVCPEQARMILPQNTLTSWIWTGTLAAWSRVYNQRSDPTAQKEVQDLIPNLAYTMERLFPVSWPQLTRRSKDEL